MKREIDVLNGVRYEPDMFLKRMRGKRSLEGITSRHVNTVYSLCWIFQFRIRLQVTRHTERYAGYYAGFDESVMSPGKLAFLPSARKQEVEDVCILADRLTEEQAVKASWTYNKEGVTRKFRTLYAVPVLEKYHVERFYKPLYVIEFYHTIKDEYKYRLLDSLTGDLASIIIQQ